MAPYVVSRITNGIESVKMENTIIVEKTDTYFIVNDGWWSTTTTKKFINRCLPAGWYVQQVKGKRWLKHNYGENNTQIRDFNEIKGQKIYFTKY